MASTVNIGPQTITSRHKDFKNLSFGLCAIIALGDFDWEKGGALCLEEPGVRLQFAPGDIIFIPSASITHYNTPIAPGETRSSLTFYTAGQLFRWVHNGFRSVSSLGMARRKLAEKRGQRFWEKGWDMYLKCPLQ